jgi:hypothetical protein
MILATDGTDFTEGKFRFKILDQSSMSRVRKFSLRAACLVGIVCVMAACIYMAVLSSPYRLVSDSRAKRFFQAHCQELDAIVLAIQHDPQITYLGASGDDAGTATSDTNRAACAAMLQKMHAQFLTSNNGAVEIYTWGSGCAICHDSYEGFAFIVPDAPAQRYTTVVPSAETSALPHGKGSEVEDGTYLVPIRDNWYIFRSEQD